MLWVSAREAALRQACELVRFVHVVTDDQVAEDRAQRVVQIGQTRRPRKRLVLSQRDATCILVTRVDREKEGLDSPHARVVGRVRVDRDEKVAASVVRDREALFERHESVVVPRHHDAQIALAQSSRDTFPDIEDELLLEETARTTRAVVFAAVAGVEHDGVEALLQLRLVASCASDGTRGNNRHRQ